MEQEVFPRCGPYLQTLWFAVELHALRQKGHSMLFGKYLPASVLRELKVEFWVGPVDEGAGWRRQPVGTDCSTLDEVGERCEEVAA